MKGLDLRNLNIIMCILHLFMAIGLTVYFSKEDFFNFESQLYKIGLTRGTFDPASSKYNIDYVLKDSHKEYLPYEVVIFFYITSLAHGIYAANPNNMYQQLINNKNNWFRWIEYAITATLMIRIIAFEVGVKDSKTLGLLTANTVAIMFCGWSVELSLKKNDKMNAKIITIIGWILLVANFSILLVNFGETVSDVKSLNCKDKVPNFVWAIILTQLVFYMSFGAIQLYQIFGKNVNYETIEKCYIWLSLISKFTLGGLLAYSVVASADGQNTQIDC